MTITEDQFQNILEQCIRSLRSGEASVEEILARYPDMPIDQKDELAAALWLAGTARLFDPRPEFVQESRRKLVARAQQKANAPDQLTIRITHLLTSLAVLLTDRRSIRYALAVILLFVFIAGSTGAAFASQNSLPGEFLYPIKLSIEGARLSISFSTAGDASLRKEYASERLAEIQSLINEREYDQLSAVADNYNFQFTQLVELLEQVSKENPEKAQKLAESYRNELKTAAQPLAAMALSLPTDQRARVTDILNGIDNKLPPANGGDGSKTPGGKSPLATLGGPPGLSGTKGLGSGSPGKRTEAPPFSKTRTPEPIIPSSTNNADIKSKTPTPTPSSTSTATHKPKPTRKPTKTPKLTKTQKPGKNDHVILFNWWDIQERNSSPLANY